MYWCRYRGPGSEEVVGPRLTGLRPCGPRHPPRHLPLGEPALARGAVQEPEQSVSSRVPQFLNWYFRKAAYYIFTVQKAVLYQFYKSIKSVKIELSSLLPCAWCLSRRRWGRPWPGRAAGPRLPPYRTRCRAAPCHAPAVCSGEPPPALTWNNISSQRGHFCWLCILRTSPRAVQSTIIPRVLRRWISAKYPIVMTEDPRTEKLCDEP